MQCRRSEQWEDGADQGCREHGARKKPSIAHPKFVRRLKGLDVLQLCHKLQQKRRALFSLTEPVVGTKPSDIYQKCHARRWLQFSDRPWPVIQRRIHLVTFKIKSRSEHSVSQPVDILVPQFALLFAPVANGGLTTHHSSRDTHGRRNRTP